jgi:hypothetical protein
MTKLVSKIQYKTFEAGEFIEEEERSFDETIKLIENFPWEAQREKIVIDLTNPSITIHGKNNDYLKLAVYFNGKFVLYYLDQKNTLFKKTFLRTQDAYPLIEEFFKSFYFSTGLLKKENTIFRNNLKHFPSQEFRYELTSDSIFRYLRSTSSISFAFTFVMLLVFLLKPSSQINLIGVLVIGFIIFFIGGGLNLVLFFNYYKYAKNLVLVMSKGNDAFLFGEKEQPQQYNKSDIIQVTVSKVNSSRHPVSSFVVLTLELKSSPSLEIPNLLIDEYALLNKLDGIPRVDKNKFPTI